MAPAFILHSCLNVSIGLCSMEVLSHTVFPSSTLKAFFRNFHSSGIKALVTFPLQTLPVLSDICHEILPYKTNDPGLHRKEFPAGTNSVVQRYTTTNQEEDLFS